MYSLLNYYKESLSCSICLELFDDPCSLPCQHVFCRSCIAELKTTKNRRNCPLCRKTSLSYCNFPRFILKDLVENLQSSDQTWPDLDSEDLRKDVSISFTAEEWKIFETDEQKRHEEEVLKQTTKMTEELKKMEEEKETALKERGKIMKKLIKARESFTEIEEKVQNEKEQIVHDHDILREKYEKTSETLSTSKRGNKQLKEKLDNAIKMYTKTISDLKSEIKAKEIEVTKVKRQLENEFERNCQKQQKEFEKELKLFKQEFEVNVKELEEAEIYNQDIQEELHDIWRIKNELAHDNNNLRKEIASKQSDASILHRELDEVMYDRNKLMLENENLQESIEKLQLVETVVKEKYKRAVSEKIDQIGINQNLEKTITEMENDITNLKKERDNSVCEQNKLTQVKTELEKTIEGLKMVEADFDRLQQEKINLMYLNQDLKEAIKRMQPNPVNKSPTNIKTSMWELARRRLTKPSRQFRL